MNPQGFTAKIRAARERNSRRDTYFLSVFGAVFGAVKSFDGKRLTKRLATAAEKADLPEGCRLYYSKDDVFRTARLTVFEPWDSGLPRMDLHLGSLDEPFSAEFFRLKNKGYWKTPEMNIAQRGDSIERDAARAEAMSDLAAMVSALCEETQGDPDRWDVLAAFAGALPSDVLIARNRS